ncbi:SDR family NAD(P)-dependent oxidoreductase [soil metagenome]
MSSSAWDTDDIPDQSGRVAVVTGANSGLGLHTATGLARKGAHVVLAVRDTAKGEQAARSVAAGSSGPDPEVRALDLSSLESVQAFAADLGHERVDLLINNAGIMMTPARKTADGFELPLGTNHLGHFALTGLLLDRVRAAYAGRIVTLSSIDHKGGHLEFDDLQLERNYSPRRAYQQSKLANATFGLELDRRLRAVGVPAISVLAHPGYSATNLQSTGPTGLMKHLMSVTNRVLAQSAEQGALPTLYAATDPDVRGGDYYGPDGFMEARGKPTKVGVTPAGRDPEVGRRLWEVSEELTGVRFELPDAVSS